jgi:2-methylisocitrate lyase-like PEP mutase family enzyme
MSLKSMLTAGRVIVAPGVYDALTAALAANAGAEVLYLSGAAIAYTRLGGPDIGLVTASEVAETVALVRDRVPTPLIVDADTGYGNALNVERTVRTFERAGATMIQLEDQSFPKRCGHLAEKRLVPAAEMAGKIRAACDARRSSDTLILARTDAIAVEGFDAAIARARLYAEAGADALFVEAPASGDDLARVPQALGRKLPLLANMVEGGKTPIKSAAELADLGFQIVIFPGAVVRMIVPAMRDLYAAVVQQGTSQPVRDRMLDFDGLNQVLGTADILARGKGYQG